MNDPPAYIPRRGQRPWTYDPKRSEGPRMTKPVRNEPVPSGNMPDTQVENDTEGYTVGRGPHEVVPSNRPCITFAVDLWTGCVIGYHVRF